ncbi:MAG: UPF0280 family protein [Proteobacteria bacterium]|nr:UPF0280 family protein [Pseudomonadota bacterium]
MPQYTERTYRKRVSARDLSCFRVVVKETDLWVCADKNLEKTTRDLIFDSRHQVETYIGSYPEFANSLLPLREDPYAPPVVKEMLSAARKVNVGPMAAVAGAIAQYVAEGLLDLADQVIVENGGDIFLKANRPLTVSVFAGASSLSGRFGLLIPIRQMPLGVCSSSATVGHSLSQGITDVVCALSSSAALADGAATALGNRVKKKKDLEQVAKWADQIQGILGGLVIVGDTMATWGDIELVELWERIGYIKQTKKQL